MTKDAIKHLFLVPGHIKEVLVICALDKIKTHCQLLPLLHEYQVDDSQIKAIHDTQAELDDVSWRLAHKQDLRNAVSISDISSLSTFASYQYCDMPSHDVCVRALAAYSLATGNAALKKTHVLLVGNMISKTQCILLYTHYTISLITTILLHLFLIQHTHWLMGFSFPQALCPHLMAQYPSALNVLIHSKATSNHYFHLLVAYGLDLCLKKFNAWPFLNAY
jgi:hypothetical protein